MGDARQERDREVAEEILESVKEQGGSERFRVRALHEAFGRTAHTGEERTEIVAALDDVKLRSDPKLQDAELDGEVLLYLKEKSRRKRLRWPAAAAIVAPLVIAVVLLTRDGDDGGGGGTTDPVTTQPVTTAPEPPTAPQPDRRRDERERPRTPEERRPPDSRAESCDPNYGGCVPPPPEPVGCSTVPGPVPVIGKDVRGLDTDGNGVACDEGPG